MGVLGMSGSMLALTISVTLGVLVLYPGAGAEISWDACKLPSELGSCDNYTVRWYYNASQDMCRRFWYGGCGGNDNRFDSEKACASHCKPDNKGTDNIVITEDDAKPSTDTVAKDTEAGQCDLPPQQGRCRDFKLRWYYDGQKTRCRQFWYGGCDGNTNRFETEEACTAQCVQAEVDVCQQPKVEGRCRARKPRYYFDTTQRRCLFFYYGGCDGNGNRFNTKADCDRQCLAGTAGLGDDRLQCDTSRFGCCPDGVTPAKGDQNYGCPNACERTRYGCCDDDITAAQGPNQEGCDAIEIGSGEEICEQTLYGCCPDKLTAAQGPNEEGCEFSIDMKPAVTTTTTTTTESPDIFVEGGYECRLPKDTGPCRNNLTVMWYYNTTNSRCQRFWYGGCQGNQNRYKSEKECQAVCANVETNQGPVCQQPKEIGPCRALIERWFHNPATRQCESFGYGGCQGNNNNFATKETCETYCEVRIPVTKPWQCPVKKDTNGFCVANCDYDGDCPGNEKCCADAMNCRSCTSPYVTRPVSREQVCSLPSEVGQCKAALPRWFFNPSSRQCEEFTYGGCGGNQNNFETEETCQRYCRLEGVVDRNRVAREPVCQLEYAVGPCRRAEQKWFYNVTTQQCSTFTYGGCLGNHNNFETETKCLSYCGLRTRGMSREETCKLPKETGGCRANIRRWFYDARDGRCYEFAYGGCQGNGNNYGSDEECMAQCRDVRVAVVRPEPVTRPPPVATPATASPYVDDEDVCSLPLTTPCNRVNGQHWYYDKSDGMCREVPDGGCNNNRNNFNSREQCEGYCSRERVCRSLTYTSEIRCLAAFPRWTYDPDTDQCEEFTYGGCGGSSNNFLSKMACEKKCRKEDISPPTKVPEPTTPDAICSLPEDSGNCLASFSKWFYSRNDGECRQFTYGGCGGNRNKFDTREECERFCSREAVCRPWPEQSGISCLAYIPSWRYEDGECRNFIYGGCGGNANNFATFEACERKCTPRATRPPPTTEADRSRDRYSTWRDICNLQADVGPCKSYIRKWYFNSLSQECEEYTYGGCLGNHNNFESRLQCMTYCDPTRGEPEVVSSGEIPDGTVEGIAVCHQPMEVGDCRSSIPSWYYEHMEGECRQFNYGGCGGNGNRFESREECNAACDAYEVCRLPQQNGPCMAYLPRYFFDYTAGECTEFVYGGCDGNANNFETKDACMRKCGPLVLDRPPTIVKNGTCPALASDVNGICVQECRSDSECADDKKCCTNGCGLVCISPTVPVPSPTGVTSTQKAGFCPPKQDRQGLLGACAPTCQYDNDCGGNQKCCHVGCGPACTDPRAENPYQMDEPESLRTRVNSANSVYLTWYDPALGREQKIKDNRFYTVRYFSYSIGQYEYKNVTELRTVIDNLNPETMYEFSTRVNDPPYLSEWSLSVAESTAKQVTDKAGTCPAKKDMGGLLGACAPTCRDDSDCGGNQKCCHVGCGPACHDPVETERAGTCPAKKDMGGLLGACAPTCRYDSDCGGNQKCCHVGCGPACHDPVETLKAGTCPAKEDMGGLLGACAPTCRYDGDCEGNQKCCHVGCGPACHDPYETRVVVSDPHSRCMHPKVQGDCDTRDVMWYYDPKIRDCRRFIFTGCHGNGNKFSTRRECRRFCYGYMEKNNRYTVRPAPVRTAATRPPWATALSGRAACQLAKEPGRCGEWEVMWFFNTEIQRCDRFWYGGCDGNNNRFSSEAECQDMCVGRAPSTRPTAAPYDCRRSRFGCCSDGRTPAVDELLSNCADSTGRDHTTVSVDPGNTGYLTCVSRVTDDDSIAWYRDGKRVESDERRTVFDNGTMVIKEVTIEDDGMYACRVRSDRGSTLYRFLIQVLVPVGIMPGPDNIVTKPDHLAFLHCQVYGNPLPSVTWKKANYPIMSNSHYEVFSNGTLLIRRANEGDVDQYTCTADNGIAPPSYRTLTLNLREMLVARIENDNGRVTEGGRMTLRCEGKGYPRPSVTWEKSGRPLMTGGTVYIQESGQLIIRDVTLDDTGIYTCIVANSEEKIETSTTVQVIPRGIEPEKCVDVAAVMKCRLIVRAGLCSYSMYSKICCRTCVNMGKDI